MQLSLFLKHCHEAYISEVKITSQWSLYFSHWQILIFSSIDLLLGISYSLYRQIGTFLYESVLYSEKQLSPSKSQGEAHLFSGHCDCAKLVEQLSQAFHFASALTDLDKCSCCSLNCQVPWWNITQELDRLVFAEGAGSDVIGDVVLEDRY